MTLAIGWPHEVGENLRTWPHEGGVWHFRIVRSLRSPSLASKPSASRCSLPREKPALGIREPKALRAKPFAEHAVLGQKVFNRHLLPSLSRIRRTSEGTKKTYNALNVTVGTTRKSIAMVPARCIRRNGPQVVDGGRRGAPGRFGMYLATVSLLTSWPSLASSFAVRRRLHNGFSRAIRTMSATASGASGGRPTRLDFQAQKRAKPRPCHPTTVAGFTIASASAHRDQTRETTTQKARSIGRSGGRRAGARRAAAGARGSLGRGLHAGARRRRSRRAGLRRSRTPPATFTRIAAPVTGESLPRIE